WSQVCRLVGDRVRLVGVAVGRRAAQLASDYECEHVDDPAELIGRSDVDVVIVTTPPHVHRTAVESAAAAGKHVLVEKPLSSTSEDARAMIDAAEAAGTLLATVSQHRFRAAPRFVRGVLDSGAVGPVRMARVIGPETGFWDTSVTHDEWKLDPAQQTVFASWAAHACDLLYWFVGAEPVEAYGRITQYGDSPPVGRSAMATYGFANDAMAQVWMSYDIPQPGLGSGLQFELIGATGIVRLDSYGAVEVGTAEGWTVPFRQKAFDPLDPMDPARLAAYADQLADLVDAVRHGTRPAVSGLDGLRSVAMTEAAERSAAEHVVARVGAVR
ncbi:Gfo/Idh/MocA family protein, partial [Desertimonas flava]